MCGLVSHYSIFLQFQMLQYNEKVLSQARKTRGYLQKQSSGLIAFWQKRYFIILEYNLQYYADETLQQSKKTTSMKEINYIKVIEAREFHLVTKKRIFELKAENQETRDLWVASLNLLINYKQWVATGSQKTNPPTKNKVSRSISRANSSVQKRSSPPSLKKVSSMNSPSIKMETQLTPGSLFARIGLQKLGQVWRQENIRNKIVLLIQIKGYYFIISCKTLLKSNQDQDFLSEELISPIQFNTLYFYDFEQTSLIKICRCNEIQKVEEKGKNIILQLPNSRLQITLEFKKTEVIDLLQLVKKIKHAIQIAKQYYNPANIKIKRNIDRLLYKFDNKSITMPQAVKAEVQKATTAEKDANSKNDLRRNIESMKKSLSQIINCCDAIGKTRLQFKQRFVSEFSLQSHQHIQKFWNISQKNLTKNEQKKILAAVSELWKLCKTILKENKLYELIITLQIKLIQRYKQEVVSKIDDCFSLSEPELVHQVDLQIKNQKQIFFDTATAFYSNKIFKQFHIDIRLVLHQIPEIPLDEKIFKQYVIFIRNTFQHICERTSSSIDKWRDLKLLLGTCNEIQFIKNSLFQEIQSRFAKPYPNFSKYIKQNLIKQIDRQISNTETSLMKKLFVSTFTTIDRGLLTKGFTQLNIKHICNEIIQKLKAFTKINRYVRRNIFQASFQEICYFYYSSLIKFNRPKGDKQYGADFYVKKIGEDINVIGEHFQQFIHQQKIYAHLNDLQLLKEFIQVDVSQIKKVCQNLKKQFGNSFTELALSNLLSLRDMSEQMKENLTAQYLQIIKNSAETSQELSIIQSNGGSLLQNWNDPRSRKSSLTLSINQFYENQHNIHQRKNVSAVWKQGYLWKKKLHKNSSSRQVKAFFRINGSKVLQYQSQSHNQANLVYQLQLVRKCYIHPDKGHIFFLDMNQYNVQLKAETSDEAKQWVKNIYEQISALSFLNNISEKERTSSHNLYSSQKDFKDPSTLDSYPRLQKEKSLEETSSSSPKTQGKKVEVIERQNRQIGHNVKTAKQIVYTKRIDDNCMQCSKGLLF